MTLTTACATPPATAKFLPSVEASLTPAGSSSMFSRSTCFAEKIPVISSKVSTKSTSLRTLRRIASSFLAAHGPINTTRASGLCCFIRRAVSVIGVSAIEIHFACSGKSFLAMTDHAGQHEVAMKGSSSGTSFRKSSASCLAQRSAPIATSNTSAKPRAFMAARSFPGVTFGPNCPTNAGATAA